MPPLRKWVACETLTGLPSFGPSRPAWVTFFLLCFFCYGLRELMCRIMACDNSLDCNDIFKFVYCSMILFLIDYYVGQNNILKFVYYSLILFLICFETFFTVDIL
jgi:hypothetical protein